MINSSCTYKNTILKRVCRVNIRTLEHRHNNEVMRALTFQFPKGQLYCLLSQRKSEEISTKCRSLHLTETTTSNKLSKF